MPDSPRVPPRFVPTLTSVIEEPPLPLPMPLPMPLPLQPESAPVLQSEIPMLFAASSEAATPRDDAAAAAATATPQGLATLSAATALRPPADDRIALAEAALFRIEEDLMHRVLQRVDLSLEERLTDAVSAAVQQQLDVMLPRLRSEIERVLRGLVVEALSRELSESTGSAPSSEPESLG